MRTEDVVVVGAGPFGLSISTFLQARSVDHTVIGRPMESWKRHMPSGMKLRSEAYGSDLSSPRKCVDVRAFCESHDQTYVDRVTPLALETFLEYADWFIDTFSPPTLDDVVRRIDQNGDGFCLELDGAGAIQARSVILAVGLLPFRTLPPELSGLPPDLVSHTSDHDVVARLTGSRVAVVGGGQSALETAALLAEGGATVDLLVRAAALNWLEPNPDHLSTLGRIRRPANKLCEGWHCQFWNTPSAFRRLPRRMRLDKAHSVLGPAGAWWLKDRVEGRIPVHCHQIVRRVEKRGDGIRLQLSGPEVTSLDVDHVVAGTGFQIDVSKLDVITPELRRGIAVEGGYPVVSRGGESSVPGLFFAGAAAAGGLGPSVRFIAGTHNSAEQTALGARRRAVRGGAR